MVSHWISEWQIYFLLINTLLDKNFILENERLKHFSFFFKYETIHCSFGIFRERKAQKIAVLVIFLLDLYRHFKRQMLGIRTHAEARYHKGHGWLQAYSSCKNIISAADNSVDHYTEILNCTSFYYERWIIKNDKSVIKVILNLMIQ